MTIDGSPVLCLDMDGVVTQFGQAALDLCLDKDVSLTESDLDRWEIHRALDLTVGEFWAMIEDADGRAGDWWANLEPYPYAHDMVFALEGFGVEVVFVTSPSRSPGCLAGKARWLAEHFPWHYDRGRLMPTRHKHLLAQPGRVLIDDGPHNIRAYRWSRGPAILFPQPWNRGEDKLREVDEDKDWQSVVELVAERL